jgi:hypothetical protein
MCDINESGSNRTIPNMNCSSGFHNFRLCRQFQVLENSMLCRRFQFAEFHVM